MKLNIADLFCGAGGTSAGALEAAICLGFQPKLTAINHWPVAIETHTANHPDARHLCTNIDDINPRTLFKPGELDLLWASPECTHHSVARGGKPINEQSRATAWCVPRWADAMLPDVILIENVPEFVSWGPVDSQRRPIVSRKGEIFAAWRNTLHALGYRTDWRVLCAADFGDPTTRRRLFIQCVRGKRKITWPNPTHGKSCPTPWVAAREIIDWNLPAQSIYERKRPLSPKTMRRIFEGLKKFGLKPVLICMEHGGSVRDINKPLPTITTAKGGAISVVEPFLVELRGTNEYQLIKTSRSLSEPLPVVSADGVHAGLVSPFLIQVAHGNGTDPNGDVRRSKSINDPLPTVCGKRGDMALCEPALLPQQSAGRLRSVSEPVPTVAATGAIALVEPFLVKYYGTATAQSVGDPLDAVTTKDRHALVRPEIILEGQRYTLDIRFRMLQPHELAAAQGFSPGYHFSGTKTDQVKQIGNAVPRRMARALVGAVLSQNPDVSAIIDLPTPVPQAAMITALNLEGCDG